MIGKSNVFIIHYKRINLKGFEFFFIDVLLFHIITLVFFFQSDLGQIQFPEMGIFFFFNILSRSENTGTKKKEIKKYPMRELEHNGIAHVVILHLNLKSFGTRLIVIRLNL